MGNIFGNSWLTICALASTSCLGGFLDHVDRHTHTIQIPFTSEKGQQAQGSFCLRQVTMYGSPGFKDSSWFAFNPALGRDLTRSRWDTRGWVFQERLLSPRLLYFGAEMVHFQYQNNIISENGLTFRGGILGSSQLSGHATGLMQALEGMRDHCPYVMDIWYALVAQLVRLQFTNGQDIFPAVAGIARRVQETTSYQYLAGLWEEDLCWGLLWSAGEGGNAETPPRRPVSLRQLLHYLQSSAYQIAPSWSWASHRDIFFMVNRAFYTCQVRSHLRSEFKLLKSFALVDAGNPYGRVRSASISLIGATIGLPPGSMPSIDSVGNQRWNCEVYPGMFASVMPDWVPIETWRSTGISKRMQSQLQLLLVCSCCSEYRINTSPQAGRDLQHGELPELPVEPVDEGNMTPDPLREEGLKLSPFQHFYEGGHPASHCSRQDLRRDIWGLLLYPAGPLNTYYRVGAFISRAKDGGSDIFRGQNAHQIELI